MIRCQHTFECFLHEYDVLVKGGDILVDLYSVEVIVEKVLQYRQRLLLTCVIKTIAYEHEIQGIKKIATPLHNQLAVM